MIGRMYVACRISEAANTLSEYVILIAFPLQQWLHERASLLRFTYTACLAIMFSTIICRLYKLTHSAETHVPLPLTVSVSSRVETFLAFLPLMEGPKNGFHRGSNLLSSAFPALES
jgi:hypothetical protein